MNMRTTLLDLLYDIRNNHQTVADARQFFKAHQRQVMIATGVNDAGDRVPPDRQRSLRA